MPRGNPNCSKLGGEHPAAKKVSQYSVDGVLIKTYNSLKEAAESVGISYQRIGNAIRQGRVSAHYLWKYADN